VGAVFALVIGLALGFGMGALAWTLGAALMACAALEAFLGFCVGCRVYGLMGLGASRD
jgi:hypothetical protein